MDFKVKLGSILEQDYRGYYIENKFSFLEEKLTTIINKEVATKILKNTERIYQWLLKKIK